VNYLDEVLAPCMERWRQTTSPTLQIRIAERWLTGQGRLIQELMDALERAGVERPDIDFEAMFRERP
jgi:hypothetical protein